MQLCCTKNTPQQGNSVLQNSVLCILLPFALLRLLLSCSGSARSARQLCCQVQVVSMDTRHQCCISPAALKTVPPVQAWLQRFAWTDKKLMFCFETAVKLLYWCGFVYEHNEAGRMVRSTLPPPSPLPSAPTQPPFSPALPLERYSTLGTLNGCSAAGELVLRLLLDVATYVNLRAACVVLCTSSTHVCNIPQH